MLYIWRVHSQENQLTYEAIEACVDPTGAVSLELQPLLFLVHNTVDKIKSQGSSYDLGPGGV